MLGRAIAPKQASSRLQAGGLAREEEEGGPAGKHSTGTNKCLASGNLPKPSKQRAMLLESSMFAHSTPHQPG